MQQIGHLVFTGLVLGLLSESYAVYCGAPLGMTTGAIANSQISASSSYDSYHDPRSSRINTVVGATAWCAKSSTTGQYLQVNFGQLTTVTAVATQGRAKNYAQWVTLYRILYSTDGATWITYLENGQIKEFMGNADANGVVKNVFATAIKTKFIRINPRAWYGHVSMRVEFYGCVSGCSFPLGISHGALDATRLSVSSSYDSNHDERGARLNTIGNAAGSWSAAHNNVHQFLQVDLGRATKVTAVATQGRSSTSYPQRVTSYQLLYSLDGSTFYHCKNVWGQVETFTGNSDTNSVVKNTLPVPVTARYIRLNPRSWYQHISMRVELFGCPEVCGYPLGLSTGGIGGTHISTSSSYDEWHNGRYSRLHNIVKSSAWCAKHNNVYQWLQVNFDTTHKITAVATQGRAKDYEQWVTSYYVYYSRNGYSWKPVTYANSKVVKLFHGNKDMPSVVKNGLQVPVIAKYLRINPRTWHNHISMRAEFYGCPFKFTTFVNVAAS